MSQGSRPARFEPKVCATCGEPFRSMNWAAKYCSRPCRAKVNEVRLHRRKQPSPKEEGGDE